MRLVRYRGAGGPTVGFLEDGLVREVSGPKDLAQIHELFATGGRPAIEKTLATLGRPLDELVLLPPVWGPTKVLGVAMNFRPFVEQIGEAVPDHPVVFNKTASALHGPYEDIELPPATKQLVPEGEVAVVIGRRIYRATAEEARASVAGFCCANDLTGRDLEFRTSQWASGKMLPGSCPIGPWLTLADSVDPARLTIQTEVNGRVVQRGDLNDLVFSVLDLVVELSQFVILEPGDVILTGTPSDLGEVEPPVFLQPGDQVSVGVDGLGVIANTIVMAQ